jgi:hypothetical protein
MSTGIDLNLQGAKGFHGTSARPVSLGPTGVDVIDNHPRHRSTAMHLLVQELSRDRMRQAQRDMEAIKLASRLRTARKQRDRRRAIRH